MIVVVKDTRIKAHRCILSSRCVYFAAVFSGSRRANKAKETVEVQGFSAEAVVAAIRHIYCGMIP